MHSATYSVHTPACYRGGDRYMSNAVARTLEEEGVQLDLTLERMPGVERLSEGERGTGVIPDCTGIPTHAFRASEKDFRVPRDGGHQGLAMLPLTAWDEGTLVPWLDRLVFEEQLEILLDESDPKSRPTHLAFVARSDLAMLPQWEDFAENIMAIARRVREGRLVFATASDTWELASLPVCQADAATD